MAEKLKIVLLGVVLLLAAAVVYGYVDDGGEQDSSGGVTVTERPTQPPVSSDSTESTPPPEKKQAGAGKGEKDDSGGKRDGTKADSGGGSGSGSPQAGSGAGAGAASESGGASGAGDSGGSSGSAAGRSDFVERAGKICSKVPGEFTKRTKQLQRDAAASGSPVTPQEIFSKAVAPTILAVARKLDALTPPAGSEAEVAAMVAALERAGNEIKMQQVADLNGKGSPFSDFAKLAGRYGLAGCSQI